MSITATIRGKRIAYAASNGHLLQLQCEDGSEWLIKWVDDNGETIKGRPVIESRGFRLKAEGMQDLIVLPRAS